MQKNNIISVCMMLKIFIFVRRKKLFFRFSSLFYEIDRAGHATKFSRHDIRQCDKMLGLLRHALRTNVKLWEQRKRAQRQCNIKQPFLAKRRGIHFYQMHRTQLLAFRGVEKPACQICHWCRGHLELFFFNLLRPTYQILLSQLGIVR